MPLERGKSDQEIVAKLIHWVSDFDKRTHSYQQFHDGIEHCNAEFFRRYRHDDCHAEIHDGYLQAMRIAQHDGIHPRPFYIGMDALVQRQATFNPKDISLLLTVFEADVNHHLKSADPEGRQVEFWQLAEQMCEEINAFHWPEVLKRLRIMARRLGSPKPHPRGYVPEPTLTQ